MIGPFSPEQLAKVRGESRAPMTTSARLLATIDLILSVDHLALLLAEQDGVDLLLVSNPKSNVYTERAAALRERLWPMVQS